MSLLYTPVPAWWLFAALGAMAIGRDLAEWAGYRIGRWLARRNRGGLR